MSQPGEEKVLYVTLRVTGVPVWAGAELLKSETQTALNNAGEPDCPYYPYNAEVVMVVTEP